jgi:hypothetical protein
MKLLAHPTRFERVASAFGGQFPLISGVGWRLPSYDKLPVSIEILMEDGFLHLTGWDDFC